MLTLNAGLSRKVGEPDYGSRGASVNLQLEVEGHLIQEPDALHDRIRRLFALARQAVDEELQINRKSSTDGSNGNGAARNPNKPVVRPATASQLRAIRSIGDRLQIDVEAECQQRFGMALDKLSLPDASTLIDDLKARFYGCAGGEGAMNLSVLENPANEIAQGMTGRNYLSLSQVTTYQSCPLRWFFQYVAQLPHERVGASLILGGAIHSALEAYYLAQMAGDPLPDLDQLLKVFDEAWQADAKAPIQFGKEETAASLKELAGRMLSAFLASDIRDPGGTILGIEEEMRTEYLPGIPDLLARVDLIFLTEEALVIRDFKTARSRWTASKLAEAAVQLVLYGDLALPMAQAYGHKPVRLEFVVLTKTKSPLVEVLTVEPDRQSLVRLRRIIERVWAAMRAGHIYPNPSVMNCSSCPFQRACRDWCD